MKIYHVETQQDYDALMSELEDKGFEWFGGRKPTSKDCWNEDKENSCIKVYEYNIFNGSIKWYKNKHPSIPIIEYRAKGENMTQEEMKRYFLNESRDISIAIENFVVDDSTTENPLLEAKSSAKKLIEKIDDYLESQKPKFKVGDYVTDTSNDNPFICKIEKFKGNDIAGIWYCVSKKLFFDKLAGLPVSNSRLSTPEEIAEYEVALTFHKHGRKPFEVKDGDLLENKFGKFIALKSLFVKENFTVQGNAFLKTVEEINGWLENK